jgi:hypothetical protein
MSQKSVFSSKNAKNGQKTCGTAARKGKKWPKMTKNAQKVT